MKYIFDFDDVLFNNTRQFKPHMYACFKKAGVPRNMAEPYYKEVRVDRFWLKNLLLHFSIKESLYEEIMKKCNHFINKKLITVIKKLGKENCYILTHGGEEFQLDKIKRTGIIPLFSDIIVVFEEMSEFKNDSLYWTRSSELFHSKLIIVKIIFIY